MAAAATTPGQVRRPAGAGGCETHVLPVLLVTGFLGSGKTTLVNHLLKSRGELRVAVFVNEFGAVDVDGAVLRSQGGVDRNRVFSLRGGCMCCGGNDDLRVVIYEELNALRQELDLLIVETSGVTDPGPVLATLAGASGVCVERTVCVVDVATATDVTFGSSPDALRQLACADVVVLSKTDLLGEDSAGAGAADKWLREHCMEGQRPQVVTARHGVVEWKALYPSAPHLGREARPSKRPRQTSSSETTGSVSSSKVATGGKGADSHKSMATHSYMRERPFDRDRFEAWSRQLPAAVLRAKGLLRVQGVKGCAVWHYAGGRSSELHELGSGEEPLVSELVILGTYGEGWSPRDFNAGLDECLVQDSEGGASAA